jgi:hypothetical protein
VEEVETGQHPERKGITNHRLAYKDYWAQWKSLALRNGILEHHWESANRQSKIAQILLPWSKVNEVTFNKKYDISLTGLK